MSQIVEPEIAKAVAFLRCTGRAKHTVRSGWVERKVPNPESIASHMHRMSLIAMLVPEDQVKINRDRLVKIALVHDLGETIIGDVSPQMKIPKELKGQAEDEAMRQICDLVPYSSNSKEIYSLFREYEDNETEESKFAHDIDLLDMLLQIIEYADSAEESLDCFLVSSDKINHPWVKALAKHSIDIYKAKVENKEKEAKKEKKTGDDEEVEKQETAMPVGTVEPPAFAPLWERK